MEASAKADETMLPPLAQKMSKVFNLCEDKTVRTELVEGLGNTYGFDMARKAPLGCWLMRVLYHNYALPQEAIPGPAGPQSGCDGIPGGSRVTYFLGMEHGAKWVN